jgi:hypothetical protein
VAACKCGNEPSDSTKCKEFLNCYRCLLGLVEELLTMEQVN